LEGRIKLYGERGRRKKGELQEALKVITRRQRGTRRSNMIAKQLSQAMRVNIRNVRHTTTKIARAVLAWKVNVCKKRGTKKVGVVRRGVL
jgi:hypothetical protein